VALRLAAKTGIKTPKNESLPVAGKAVLLSRRFDRAGDMRVPFLSAMAMMGMKDGEHGSYPPHTSITWMPERPALRRSIATNKLPASSSAAG
jgi:hypothetical protein